ncbi:MAG: hypothetical protein ACRETL_03835, partial [Gammaproteobacteria bacterium]
MNLFSELYSDFRGRGGGLTGIPGYLPLVHRARGAAAIFALAAEPGLRFAFLGDFVFALRGP